MINTKIGVNFPIKKLSEFLGEYHILTNFVEEEMSFETSFELRRKIRTLDKKVFLLMRKIDPIYVSVIKNNFNADNSSLLTTIPHRISLIESMIHDLDQMIVNYQINI